MTDLQSISPETIAFLALSSVDGIGYKTLYEIRKAGVRFQDVLAAPSQQFLLNMLAEANIRNSASLADRIISNQEVIALRARETFNGLESRRIRLIHETDPAFPPNLRDIEQPPGWLFVEGNSNLLNRPTVTIVGSRDANAHGVFLTQCVCYLLAETDICTVSGLADGIDREVHESSLDMGIPTIAVLGNGLNQQYPASASELRERILQAGGCIVSEYLLDDAPNRSSFVWRNRIQAGLSKVTIPTQWRLKSGTAHTVNFAINGGRRVIGVKLPVFPSGPEQEFLEERHMPTFRLPIEGEEFRETLFRYFD
jgi:DNA protecting protein DprA